MSSTTFSRTPLTNADITILADSQFSPQGEPVNMGDARERGGKTRAGRLLSLAGLALASAIVAGCSAAHKNTGDPLFGEFPKGTGGPAASSPAATSRVKETSAVPSATGPNLASLAGGLPDSRPLGIWQPDSNGAVHPEQGPTALASVPKTSAATLSPPVPVVQPVPRVGEEQVVPASSWQKGQSATIRRPPAPPVNDPGHVPTVGGGIQVPQAAMANPANPANPTGGNPAAPVPRIAQPYDSLLSQLRARGVTWQKAQNVAEGVRFSCIVPNPQHPETMHTYETVGPDYAAAVQAALWQIDKEQKQAGR